MWHILKKISTTTRILLYIKVYLARDMIATWIKVYATSWHRPTDEIYDGVVVDDSFFVHWNLISMLLLEAEYFV